MGITVERPIDLTGMEGRPLGATDWIPITQENIDTFGRVTRDQQWIHCDVERAKSGPFGGTIAHGYLTLSLVGPLFAELLTVRNVSMIVNYGLDRVRFPSPVLSGARVRLTGSISEVTEVGGGYQLVADTTVEVEGADKPACVARAVYRYFT